MIGWLAFILAIGWFVFLFGERFLLARARARVPVVIHVNGTRGKSETTRLIAAALRASGIRTLAKTTGTEPRLILPDGNEIRLRRRGAADVREQRWLLFEARRLGAKALVAECMAVRADAQYASDAFLSPSILAVTNVRADHRLELGDVATTMEVFSRGIPVGGQVLTSDPAVAKAFAGPAAAAGAELMLTVPLEGSSAVVPDNAGLALAVARAAGASNEASIVAMRNFLPDPGAFSIRRLPTRDGGELTILNALAANDVASTEALIGPAGWRPASPRSEGDAPSARRVLLIACRADRPDRSQAFARWAAANAANWDEVLLSGFPSLASWLCLRSALPPGPGHQRVRHVARRQLSDRLATLAGGSIVVAVGNWKGVGPLLAEGSHEF
jgi:poly-gamma-glutamate synthase PgsB/CapB